jgi:hypothetical protein
MEYPGLQIFSFGHCRKTAENARNSSGPARFTEKPTWFLHLREDFTTGNDGREWYILDKGGNGVPAQNFSQGAHTGLVEVQTKFFHGTSSPAGTNTPVRYP